MKQKKSILMFLFLGAFFSAVNSFSAVPRPVYDQRYIDFEKGSDMNPGSRERPWKHHPWDKAAKWQAAMGKGIHTYYFKKGVIYRGALVVKESGEPDHPIYLTVDSSWGEGKASIYGSVRITTGWNRCTNGECPKIPQEGRKHTWYIDLRKGFVPRILWEIHNDKVIRINIARIPNWKITNPDDPRSEWWELTDSIVEVKIFLNNTNGFEVGEGITGNGIWTDKDENRDNLKKGRNRIVEVAKKYIKIKAFEWKKGEIKAGVEVTSGKIRAKVLKISGSHDVISHLKDQKKITQINPEYWVGATMWAEKESMPKPDAEKVIGYDPIEQSLKIKYHRGIKGPRKYDRYFLENLPKFLDVPGEYYYCKSGRNSGRLFVRLPENRNPNQSIIEAAKENVLLDIKNKNNILISGLEMRFANAIACGTKKARLASLHASAVRIIGNCCNIKIINSEINNLPAGIIAFPEKNNDTLDYIEVSDNAFYNIDGTPVGLSNGKSHYKLKKAGARLIHVNVFRNKVYNVGYRVLSHWSLGPHAIHVEGGELVDIAGNVVNRCWGSGIIAVNGSQISKGSVKRSLVRILIHHNKVTNSLLGMQDYGGIASWRGGPSYIYSNISGNPVGYKHAHYQRLKRKNWYRTSCYGVGIYLDAQYKGYVFNNIIWGKNNNVNHRYYNSTAFNEAAGFMNTVFNNTMYRFGIGIHKGMFQHNRCYYLGNMMLDMGHKFIQQEPIPSIIEYHSLGYANNIFQGNPSDFGQLGRKVYGSLCKWKKAIEAKNVMVTQTGKIMEKPQVVDVKAHNFQLKPDSIAIDNGVKVFVPWGLYGVVGEWNFFRHPADPKVILGENMNWNNECHDIGMLQDIPRNNLIAHNIDESSFKFGLLEDWVKGSLKLNGRDQYCDIANSLLKKGYKWSQRRFIKGKHKQGFYAGKDRITLDMDSNNFLIEVVLQTVKKFNGGGIVSKRTHRGYSLGIDKKGYAKMLLDFGASECSRISRIKINDGLWHHVIAEVDRNTTKGINIYVDGKLSNGNWKGKMDKIISLSNSENFNVGKTTGAEEKYFNGSIDFLRLSQGTLKDAETSIEELYNWEFAGPSLKDFYGKPITGKRRDAGALEYD